MSWWRRPKMHFHVTLRLSGKHPYVPNRQDYPDRDVTVSVHARSWNAAEMEGFRCADPTYWSARVIAIAKANAGSTLTSKEGRSPTDPASPDASTPVRSPRG